MRRQATWILLLIACLIGSGARAILADSQQAIYLPLVAKAGAVSPTPTPPTPGAYRFPQGQAALPITCLDSAMPFPIRTERADTWLITCYRVDAGDQNGAWTMLWSATTGAVTLAQRIGARDIALEQESLAKAAQLHQAAPDAVQPGQLLCPSRVELYEAPDGYGYALCYPSSTGRARTILSIRVGEWR